MAVPLLKDNLDALQKKAKERTVKTQNIEYDMDTLVKRIDRKSIKLDPDYQRRHRWSTETASRLIESLILNIPIPVIFISQDIDVDEEAVDSAARYTVIDGQQRLTAIYDFMKNKLQLFGLDALKELNGCYYKDLPSFLTRRLEERTIKCLRIDSTVDAQVKYDIFERLNTGAVKLESQELRNATARGPFNDALKAMAELEAFRILIQVDLKDPEASNKVQKMEDVELALRFFALRNDGYKNLKKGFRDFLTDRLVEFNALNEGEIASREAQFKAYMTFILQFAGRFAFAKWKFEGGGRQKMSSFNAAVFDAVAVGLSQVYSADQILMDSDLIVQKLTGYENLFADKDFFSAVSGSVNDAAKVTARIDAMVAYLRR